MGMLLMGRLGMGKPLRRRLDIELELLLYVLELLRRLSLLGSWFFLRVSRPPWLLRFGLRLGVLL